MEKMNIHQKIVEVRKSIDGFHKDGESYKYKYVTGNQVLGKIKEKLDEFGIIIVPMISETKHDVFNYSVKNQNKTDFIVSGIIAYRWINADDPKDYLEIPFYFAGQQDDISKAFGSGLTYSERYHLLKVLSVPTDNDDPDSRDTSGKTSINHLDEAMKLWKENGGTVEQWEEWYKDKTQYSPEQVLYILNKKLEAKQK
jgi:hypothetical protein